MKGVNHGLYSTVYLYKNTHSMKIFFAIASSCFIMAACQSPVVKQQPEAKIIAMSNQTDSANTQAFICKLTTPELRKRKAEVIGFIKKQVKVKKELANGYRYWFDGTDEMIETITAFIKSERSCCGFFDFTMTVTRDEKVSLDITGAEGVKEFIRLELEM